MVQSTTPGPSRLIGQAFRSIVVRYLVVAVGTAISVLLSRALEAEGRGSYAFVIALASSIAWGAHLSVEAALVIEWASSQRAKLVGAALTIACLAGVLGAGIATAWMWVADLSLPDGVETWMVVAALVTTPLVLLALYGNAVFANEGRIGVINGIALVAAMLQLTGLLILIGFGVLSVGAAVLLWAASMALPAFPLVTLLIRSPGVKWPGWRRIWGLALVGLKYHPGVLALALMLRIDIILLGSRVSVSQVGIYSLAVALVEMTLVATAASSQVALQVQVQGKPEENADFAATVARTNGLLSAVVLIALICVGPWAITLVFGESFKGTYGAVLLLVPGMYALSKIRPLGVYLSRLRRPGVMSGGMIVGLIVNVGLNLLLIPIWGIQGAALASTIVYVGVFTWEAVWFSRATGLPISSVFPSALDLENGLAMVQARLRRSQ